MTLLHNMLVVAWALRWVFAVALLMVGGACAAAYGFPRRLSCGLEVAQTPPGRSHSRSAGLAVWRRATGRKCLAAASLVALVLGLTSCSADEPTEKHVRLDDGREVVCVATSDSYRAGLSCDWDGAR